MTSTWHYLTVITTSPSITRGNLFPRLLAKEVVNILIIFIECQALPSLHSRRNRNNGKLIRVIIRISQHLHTHEWMDSSHEDIWCYRNNNITRVRKWMQHSTRATQRQCTFKKAAQVCRPYVVTLLNWTPTSEWFMNGFLLKTDTIKTCFTMKLDYVLRT